MDIIKYIVELSTQNTIVTWRKISHAIFYGTAYFDPFVTTRCSCKTWFFFKLWKWTKFIYIYLILQLARQLCSNMFLEKVQVPSFLAINYHVIEWWKRAIWEDEFICDKRWTNNKQNHVVSYIFLFYWMIHINCKPRVYSVILNNL